MSEDPADPEEPHVLLRPLRVEDADALCALLNQPGTRQGTLRPPFQRTSQTRRYIEALSDDDLTIVAVNGEAMLGQAGLHRLTGRRRHCASLHIAVADAHVGRGIGTTLLTAVIDAADNWLDVRRLELTVFADNTVAIGLYRRFGFEEEGRLRGYGMRNGTYCDALIMARLRGI
ncbi:GNAT family N-acetyltransferase [Aurantimonas sp. MSK8Z-1]|uniref:GNAT family N-acetyltransferase n=1 Tax=Mangrovibrevibacter kandeliae TaxID=2968473 RepID=UPI00211842EC|nr:GNAT family N-acetyltransferase [Aurantimonas sp. MSK8Z-1]MCW4113964.1 GNAT family N-acetyltransferase [Aurantimonas sp. MSK8Z-1]